MLKLTGRVVNDRMLLGVTRRPAGGILPQVAAGGGIRLFFLGFVVLPRLASAARGSRSHAKLKRLPKESQPWRER